MYFSVYRWLKRSPKITCNYVPKNLQDRTLKSRLKDDVFEWNQQQQPVQQPFFSWPVSGFDWKQFRKNLWMLDIRDQHSSRTSPALFHHLVWTVRQWQQADLDQQASLNDLLHHHCLPCLSTAAGDRSLHLWTTSGRRLLLPEHCQVHRVLQHISISGTYTINFFALTDETKNRKLATD